MPARADFRLFAFTVKENICFDRPETDEHIIKLMEENGAGEKMAALDPRAENELYQNFHRIIKGKAAVFISHRMSSTRFCDQL